MAVTGLVNYTILRINIFWGSANIHEILKVFFSKISCPTVHTYIQATYICMCICMSVCTSYVTTCLSTHKTSYSYMHMFTWHLALLTNSTKSEADRYPLLVSFRMQDYVRHLEVIVSLLIGWSLILKWLHSGQADNQCSTGKCNWWVIQLPTSYDV